MSNYILTVLLFDAVLTKRGSVKRIKNQNCALIFVQIFFNFNSFYFRVHFLQTINPANINNESCILLSLITSLKYFYTFWKVKKDCTRFVDRRFRKGNCLVVPGASCQPPPTRIFRFAFLFLRPLRKPDRFKIQGGSWPRGANVRRCWVRL